MIKKIGLYWGCFAILMWVASCAQINALTGGSNDSHAPSIDSAGTMPFNGQTNFKSDRVVIKFNEFITLNKAKENIIITPQFALPPIIEAKNKKLTIVFSEPLADNTTYTISFNHAIQDITEKNDSVFQYVFSTGIYIDSLSVSGRITDAFTNQPLEGHLVGLYSTETSHQFDSIPFHDRPVYIAQSNKAGLFNMNYLKAGDYFIFGIQDQNKNLKLDGVESRCFVSEERITVGEKNEFIELQSFKPETGESKLTAVKFDYPGKLEFILSNQPDTFTVKTVMPLAKEETEKADSLVFWLTKNPESKMSFVVNLNQKTDTLKPLYKGIPESKVVTELKFTDNLLAGKLVPNSPFKITVSEPVDSINPMGIHFLAADSVELDQVNFVVQNIRTLIFDPLPNEVALVKIDSGAVNSWYNHSNQKNHWIPINVLKPDYFGTLVLTTDTLFNQAVFVDLLDEKNKVVTSVPFANQLVFSDLLPGKYQIRLILDDNGDGQWTTGSLTEKRNPEKVIYNKELIDIKSKWEKEVDWIIQN